MVNTILLIAILVVFYISIFLIGTKLKELTITINKISQNILKLHDVADSNNKAIEHLLDRFSERALIDNENYYNIVTLLKSRSKDLDNAAATNFTVILFNLLGPRILLT